MDTALDRSVVFGNSRLGYLVRRRLRDWPADPSRMDGTSALVTGATAGLGLATATGLARLGATVHLLGRQLDRLEQARKTIVDEVPDATLELVKCDVSVLSDVRAVAADLTGALDILIHNAGLLAHERTETVEGNEQAIATHVLGPFLLTDLLRTGCAWSSS